MHSLLTMHTFSTAVACGVMASSSLLTSCGATHHSTVAALPSAGFAVFDSVPVADDTVPREVATALSQSAHPEFSNADIRAARRVLANSPGWLIPATNGALCLVRLVYPLVASVDGTASAPIPSQTCAPESAAQAGRLVETQSLATSGTQARDAKVVGVVPNGVTTVDILLRHRSSMTVAVIRNAYEAVVAAPFAVRFVTSRHGDQRVTIPLTTFSTRSRSPQPIHHP
jgi:hypothetical protein